MNKKKNYKQFGGECELDTHHYKCDEDDSNCMHNIVDLLLRTEFKGTLSEASIYGGITEELKSAINNYYDKYEEHIENAMAPKCSGEVWNFCSAVSCKMRALNNYYLLYKQFGQSKLEQKKAKRKQEKVTKFGEVNETWKDYVDIPGWK